VANKHGSHRLVIAAIQVIGRKRLGGIGPTDLAMQHTKYFRCRKETQRLEPRGGGCKLNRGMLWVSERWGKAKTGKKVRIGRGRRVWVRYLRPRLRTSSAQSETVLALRVHQKNKDLREELGEKGEEVQKP